MREVIKIILVIIAVIVFAFFLVLEYVQDSFSGTRRRLEFTSLDKKSMIYIKSYNWGVTGDYQRTVITTDEDFDMKEDSTQEFIFDDLNPFLFRQSGDTLYLYVDKMVDVPTEFKSDIIVEQVVVGKDVKRGMMHNPEYRGI